MTKPGHAGPPDIPKAIPSEDVVRMFMETSSEGVFVIDREDRVEYVNRAAASLFRCEPEDLIGRPRRELFPDPEGTRQALNLGEVFRAGIAVEDHQIQWFANPEIQLEIQLHPVRAADGSVRAVLGICKDVTRRRRAEEQLLVQRDLAFSLATATTFNQATKCCLDAALRSSGLDCGGAYLVDPATGDMDLVTAWNLSEDFVRKVCHYSAETGHVARVRAGSPVYAPIESFPANSAAEMIAEGLTALAVLPVLHGDRAVACLNVGSRTLRDIPEHVRGALEAIAFQIGGALARIQAEESLRQSEHLYRSTVDSLEEWIHVVDIESRIILVNETFRRLNQGLGLEIAPLGKKPWEIYPFLPAKVQEEYRQVFQTGQAATVDDEMVLGGRAIVTRTKKVPVFDGGRVVRVITLVQDITQQARAAEEREHLEARMQQAQKFESLGVLAGGVAHDFNNLLTGIIGNAELAMAEVPAGSKVQDRIQRLRSAALRASDLTRQMLDYSGKGTRSPELLDLSEVVREMSRLLEASIPKKTRISYHFGAGLPAAEVDATQIRQVVMNLILNASEAIGDASGVITVRTWSGWYDPETLAGGVLLSDLPEGTYVGLEVEDTGCGMAPDTVARIFDPFYTTKFTGRGLGLAAVLGIIRGHRGTVRVETRLGEGARFQILLPASDKALGERKEEAKTVDWRGSGLALVADDDETIRDMAQESLRSRGFQVAVAADAGTAQGCLNSSGNDLKLLLLDLAMPGFGGAGTIEGLLRKRPHLRIVVTSGSSQGEALEALRRIGVRFLKKPYGTRDLLAAVREACAGGNGKSPP